MRRQNRRWMAAARKGDSIWECDLRDGPLSTLDYHPPKVEYTIAHKYSPDFRQGPILVEAKGRFREIAEASKYLHVRNHLAEGEELIFLFQNPSLPMPHARMRKDGTKRTHAEWAEANGFTWYGDPTALLNYINTKNSIDK